jgi:ABC-type lipoprotein export system ATPase subunit
MILCAKGLRKHYGGSSGVDAVVRADLTVGEAELVSIVGRSGSGKSTLLAMVGGLTSPTEGKIQLAGEENIWDLPETRLADVRRRHIGFVFQFSSLLSNLRAVDNVALPALLGRDVTPERGYARADLEVATLSDAVSTRDAHFILNCADLESDLGSCRSAMRFSGPTNAFKAA